MVAPNRSAMDRMEKGSTNWNCGRRKNGRKKNHFTGPGPGPRRAQKNRLPSRVETHTPCAERGRTRPRQTESIAMSTEAEKSGGAPAPVRCQRIGCDAMFTEDDNPDGSCHYHPSGPIFHDGMKEWSCCKQRSHDFSLFLAIPGCTTGKHTTEKPVTKAVSANPPKAAPIQSSKQGVGTDACSRCCQGFFCSDHGSQPKAQKPAATNGTNMEPVEKPSVPPPKKKIDLNEPRICKNKGCGKTYKEKDNHDAACQYHPGPAVFHDRMRGWKCCDIHVKEFDEFMEIPPCTKGWHNADAA